MYKYEDERNVRIRELEAEVVMLRALLVGYRKRLAKYERKKGWKK